jgi:predicted acylesterase/phospholipase RssA
MARVQIAFQGGGAKLVNMLAVAEELERAHNQGEITITRVAGTSAGSIVACLLASGTGIGAARTSLQSEEMKRVAAELSNIGWFEARASFLAGQPMRSMQPLKDWLLQRLQGKETQPVRRTVAEVSAMRGERSMELLVVSSDLANRGSRPAQPGDDVLTAIGDSCGIPFVFRTWRGEGYRHVDGGLCSNLPVDFLLDKVKDLGEVLAVSFESQPTEPHSGLLPYLLALVDTAISAAETKARSALPAENVMLISTDLATMDFAKALAQGLGEQYARIKYEAAQWLRTYLSIRDRKALSLKVDPWREPSAGADSIMTQVGMYFEALEANRYISYLEATLLIVANSLRSPSDIVSGASDALEFTLQFMTIDQPIHMLSMNIANIDPDSSLDASTLACTITDSNNAAVPATLIPMKMTNASNDRHVCVCLSAPLPAESGPYTLKYRIRGTNFMTLLSRKGEEEIDYHPMRTQRAIRRLNLVLQVPENYPVEVSYKGVADATRRLDEGEMPAGQNYGMRSYGFTAENVEKRQDLWRMVVKKVIP